MTMNAKRRRVHDKLAELPGVRAVRRPVSPGSDELFDLFYVRAGRKSAHPVVIIPGGPGVASIRPYRSLRRRAAAAGFDVIMIEHRGIGMSRHTDAGADLPPAAITVEQVVDDIAGVLDDAGVHEAVLYGTSYGSYIAAGFGVRHPDRVAAMVLDSPLLSTADIDVMRSAIRGLLWEGTDPETVELAPKVRRLVADGALATKGGELAGLLYGFGGAPLLDRQLDLLLRGRTLVWSGLSRLSRLSTRKAPYRNEVDLVGRIAFRELNYAGVPDGLPLDPALGMADMIGSAKFYEPFEAEPFDLVAELPNFHWPTVVVSGDRDLITPPAIAERIAALVPGAVLVRMPTVAHSVLDTRERAAFAVIRAVCDDAAEQLSATADELDALPARGAVRVTVSAITAVTAVEIAMPSAQSLGHRFSKINHPRQ
ncbi:MULTISPECIES: alpha/beta fold hydrolase [unclassified Mycolicibacterium]|uniref:alpha/beta fold hydrolase n=1 Tax=unclassified Mycolicibacterium TaxID=2636767 RepID=UPI0012DF87CC|nr:MULTISPECIES: alpha/beta fold hydrolase [unclassified Mycolicibacterium]MUL84878.1 alpha/beta hydrolase [Mycolicibacterium sp. CBMA 329]MUL90845.1 alpha/beta hydrolase [Mycolicibacterium sp. CBMA 331]MUM01793.1 alpha/beta hydrolase [Mycolicibacterium sp. CBMA 334]MUM26604.1 alpha/beta hydrolase [Mycolicibacterium sp. CBMA 295]MUM40604.1 alpha/beta hydrolase [Mycolicibacterium sp. CBMA 247]